MLQRFMIAAATLFISTSAVAQSGPDAPSPAPPTAQPPAPAPDSAPDSGGGAVSAAVREDVTCMFIATVVGARSTEERERARYGAIVGYYLGRLRQQMSQDQLSSTLVSLFGDAGFRDGLMGNVPRCVDAEQQFSDSMTAVRNALRAFPSNR